MNRVLTAQSQATSGGDCWGLNFGVDQIANLTSETVTKCSMNSLTVWLNAKNWITNTNFAYDLDGRLTSDGSYTYSFDAEDRLTSAAGATYSYDGSSLRVMKSSGTIYWRGVGGNTLVESDGGGTSAFLQLAFVLIQMLRIIFHLTSWPERTRLALVRPVEHDSGPHLPACFAADCP